MAVYMIYGLIRVFMIPNNTKHTSDDDIEYLYGLWWNVGKSHFSLIFDEFRPLEFRRDLWVKKWFFQLSIKVHLGAQYHHWRYVGGCLDTKESILSHIWWIWPLAVTSNMTLWKDKKSWFLLKLARTCQFQTRIF